MKRMNVREEVRKIRFEQAHEGWESGRLTQAEAARLPGCAKGRFGVTWFVSRPRDSKG